MIRFNISMWDRWEPTMKCVAIALGMFGVGTMILLGALVYLGYIDLNWHWPDRNEQAQVKR